MSLATAVPSERQEMIRLMQARDWAAALSSVDTALRSEPHDARLWISRAQCLLALGRSAEACAAAATAQLHAGSEAVLFDAIGSLFNHGNDQVRALAAYDRAVSLAPANPHFLFNRAAALRFVGRLAEAESDYDRVIALKPDDFEAYKNRSELRPQSADQNHIGELESLLARGFTDWRGEVQVRYALAKEYEDVGDYAASFRQLRRGAAERRRHMRYDVTVDVATVDWIIDAFPAVPAAATNGVVEPAADAPIFIVGLPRSGTTLVDRILGSHSAIFSAGELNHLALCIVEAVRRGGPAQLPRRELVARSADLDFAALGRDYLDKVRRGGVDAVRFTDKMPLNYLYCGLIQRALPNAKIVHVIRQPMAACYSMYKTLFKDGYPFSYDLKEIARYFIGYRRLMDHWQTSAPGTIYPLSYEALVADQRGETRKLLEFCGLEWQDACVEFHRNPMPTTTASASQVRRRLYDSSVSQWRHYATELKELSDVLRDAGITVDP
jgi:thioredoxin-like negative regulator of GroEL